MAHVLPGVVEMKTDFLSVGPSATQAFPAPDFKPVGTGTVLNMTKDAITFPHLLHFKLHTLMLGVFIRKMTVVTPFRVSHVVLVHLPPINVTIAARSA